MLNIGKDHKVYIDKGGVREYAFPAKRITGELKTAKMTAGANLDTTLEPALFLKNGVDDGHHPEATGGWDYFYVMFETDTGVYSGIVNTKVTDRGRVFHDITEIQKESGPPTRGVNRETPPPAKTDPLPSDPIIPSPGDGVNIEYAPGGGMDILTETALQMSAGSRKPLWQKRNMETIRRAASTFGSVGAQKPQEFYQGSSQAPEEYFGGFAVYYHAGLTGQDIMTVQGDHADAINYAQAEAAYLAGHLDAAESLKAEKSSISAENDNGSFTSEAPDDIIEKGVVRLKVKYIGPDYVALPTGTVCEVLSIEKGWYRVMTELDESYLFPPNVFELLEGSEADVPTRT